MNQVVIGSSTDGYWLCDDSTWERVSGPYPSYAAASAAK